MTPSPLVRRAGTSLMVFVALSWIPWAFSEYHTHVFVISLYYVILAIGWNLLAGYAGQFSLAHHTFAGIGAYTSALLVHHTHVPIVVGIVAGVLVAGAIRYFLGSLCPWLRPICTAPAAWLLAASLPLLFP